VKTFSFIREYLFKSPDFTVRAFCVGTLREHLANHQKIIIYAELNSIFTFPI